MEPGDAQLACNTNFTEARNLALDVFPLSAALGSLAETGFRGSMLELLAQLDRLACDGTRRSPSWPRTPSSLGNLLPRIADNLRSAGIQLDFNRQHGGGRTVSVRSS